MCGISIGKYLIVVKSCVAFEWFALHQMHYTWTQAEILQGTEPCSTKVVLEGRRNPVGLPIFPYETDEVPYGNIDESLSIYL